MCTAALACETETVCKKKKKGAETKQDQRGEDTARFLCATAPSLTHGSEHVGSYRGLINGRSENPGLIYGGICRT